ncbi:Gfo/Idh/MocA family protein [Streptomyces sp. N35]|uniref:Gfo/Idh/MocA family protein n=1 Tax=Streptomyces sp. N35 TaxID=2795730 RepID=UPI0018F647B3|nr:Gfo/Idh/MocA family oxidoreductase [Streptomyces sp. N35]
MTRKTVRIAMNGVTGRMGYRQHLVRSILALREQGGLDLGDGTVLWPEPVLVGRREHALRALAEKHGLDQADVSTDVDAVLADDSIDIFFDAAMTSTREGILKKAIAAGKHIYTEKPSATSVEGALELARLANSAGVKHGVVQDKIFLPGLLKLKRLIDGGFFGRILSVRGEFGYWVFEGDWQEAQRPSWNYRAEDGGGIVVDMFPHWEYVLHELFGRVKSVTALASTHIPQRWDEQSKPYDATADDAAYGIFELESPQGSIVAQINSSWAVRVNRDELVEFQVDGTEGSAVAGLRNCRAQHRSATPKPVWNPDIPVTESFRDQWQEVPDNGDFDNGFKVQWELFLRHVVLDEPYHWDLLAGARGVQLAELGLKSSSEGRRYDVPELNL